MSESFMASRIEQPGDPVLKPGCIDLNGIVAGVIAASKERLMELQAIVRQDELAPARGEEHDLRVLFTDLLEIILNHPPQNGKLFIYIRSVQNDPASDNKMVTVSIHTNTDYHPEWEKPIFRGAQPMRQSLQKIRRRLYLSPGFQHKLFIHY
jgi:hypothetical protein